MIRAKRSDFSGPIEENTHEVLRSERRLLVLGDGASWIRTWFEGLGVVPKAMIVCRDHLRKRCR